MRTGRINTVAAEMETTVMAALFEVDTPSTMNSRSNIFPVRYRAVGSAYTRAIILLKTGKRKREHPGRTGLTS